MAERTARDIFGTTTPRKPRWNRFEHVPGEKKPRKLNIRVRPCKGCGETTTSLTNYTCPRKQFGGWWGRWKDVKPCNG